MPLYNQPHIEQLAPRRMNVDSPGSASAHVGIYSACLDSLFTQGSCGLCDHLRLPPPLDPKLTNNGEPGPKLCSTLEYAWAEW